MLNPDGSRHLDAQGKPIPTYDIADITEIARFITGLSYGEPSSRPAPSARSDSSP